MNKGVVILAHGSRAIAWEANQLVVKIVEMYKAKMGNKNVKPAYMNSQSGGPSLEEAVTELVNEGLTEIIVAPWFLTDGLHIREDIPEIINTLEEKYPQIKITLAKVLGADERIVDILIDRVEEAK